MSPRVLAYGLACSVTLATPLLAQNRPSPPTTQAPTGQPSAAVQAEATLVKVEGCVFKEVDAPGRRPPDEVRSRVEADDDYVLTNTKMIEGQALSSSTAPQAGATPVGTSGITTAPPMYKVKDIGKGKLKDEIGHRVQIEGTLQHVDRAANPVSFAFDLVELRGTTIKRIEGECPKKD
jgi:hypothetical protein